MQVDKITLQDIGLFDNEEHKGLLSHLNFCKTNGGFEIFTQFLKTPLASIQSIEDRQEALAVFINQLSAIEQMSISNGTTLVIEKFFETPIQKIPIQISLPGAYWYQFWDKADYSIIQYSLEHLIVFMNNLKAWCLLMKEKKHNPIVSKLVVSIQQQLDHPFIENLPTNAKIKNPQKVLQMGYFFLYHFKNQTRELIQDFYTIDAYYSMAKAIDTYHFNFPTWIPSDRPLLEVTDARHPLVTSPICNSATLNAESNFMFLTGANMAGKSTFIKAIGNVVYLSHIGMGAPAKKVTLSLFDGLITNLTIADNIVKGESYFYNEVQRIKNTVLKISDGKKYCVLIDELFKGTNIQDAMKCSIQVIEGLQKQKTSLFILSTHLYEISDALKKYTNIQFSYFETQVKDKELVFHYTLQKGVSQDRIGYLILEREGVVDLLNKL
jgi:DNA mismatch repair ATPase MutS